MAIFPYYQIMEDTNCYSKAEITRLAVAQYLMVAMCLATLAWLLHNVVTILVRQKKYKVLPLLNFYIIAGSLLIFRILF